VPARRLSKSCSPFWLCHSKVSSWRESVRHQSVGSRTQIARKDERGNSESTNLNDRLHISDPYLVPPREVMERVKQGWCRAGTKYNDSDGVSNKYYYPNKFGCRDILNLASLYQESISRSQNYECANAVRVMLAADPLLHSHWSPGGEDTRPDTEETSIPRSFASGRPLGYGVRSTRPLPDAGREHMCHL